MMSLVDLPLARVLAGAAIGAASGAHASIWGMYKDAIHEGFSARRFARSIIVGLAAGSVLPWLFGLDPLAARDIIVLFGLAYGVERAIVEGWKMFIRDEDQSKYFIPMQFTLPGRTVTSRRIRLFAGLVCALVLALGATPIVLLEFGDAPARLPYAAVAGFAIGLFIAIGGAWKDAPKEGFEVFKFFRSPLMTMSLAMAVSLFTESHLAIVIASIGYERGFVETYKTFFFPSKPRGKFAGMPVLYPEMLHRRQRFVPAFASIWIGLGMAVIWAI